MTQGPKHPNRPVGPRILSLPAPANDNECSGSSAVSCDLPERLGILSGEAELIARYLPDLLKIAANDNETE